MGRVAYHSMASYFPTAADDPNAEPLNAARKVVFSRTLKNADWANTTIAPGDLAEEVDKAPPRRRRLHHRQRRHQLLAFACAARPDRRVPRGVTLVPYLAGEGTRLFENVGKYRQLDLLSSTAFSSGLQLDYRRHR
jgi:hypothetical protein